MSRSGRLDVDAPGMRSLHRSVAALVAAGAVWGIAASDSRIRPPQSAGLVPLQCVEDRLPPASLSVPALHAAAPGGSERALPQRGLGELLEEGDAAYDRRDFGAASLAYGLVLEREPGSVPAWVGRGNARARQGQLRGALGDLEHALRLLHADDPRRPLVEADRWAVWQALFPDTQGVEAATVSSAEDL